MTKKEVIALEKILDYLWEEQAHYEETKAKDHIYHSIKIVARFVKSARKQLKKELKKGKRYGV